MYTHQKSSTADRIIYNYDLCEHVCVCVCVCAQAAAAMVEECCKFVNQTPDLATKLKLIDTLRSVTEGKVWLEWRSMPLTQGSYM